MVAITAHELEIQMPDASQLLSDEPEMESSLHYMQLLLLVTCLEWAWQDRDDFFIGANLTIYFSRQQLRNRDFRGPDLFLVKNTTRSPRNSWVVWEEDGKYPDLIIELLSESTAQSDRTVKRNLYAQHFHTPEYFYFSPQTLEFAGFRLDGNQYRPIVPNSQGWMWSEVLGAFLGINERKLRYFSLEGALLPTPAEAAKSQMLIVDQERRKFEVEQQKVQQERERTDQERQRADQELERANEAEGQLQKLQAKIRSLGITLD